MESQVRKSILKIKNPSLKQFLEMWKQYQPFLIEDVAKYWHACNNWSNDYLIKYCGNNVIHVEVSQKDFLDDYKNFAYDDADDCVDEKKMKYKEYIKHVEDKVNENQNDDLGYYLTGELFEKSFPEIIGDVTYPEYLNRKPLVSYWHGFSSKNFSSTTVLHFDGFHNIFVQIRGRKKILLYPPSNYLSFYPPLEDSHGLADYSKVDPNHPNLELFPKFPWQERMEVVLQPGEMLYIPPYWWHYVTAVDENISLSFFYDVTIQDYFRQKNMFSVFLNIAPHYLYHAISSKDGLRTSIALIKSIILPGSFTQNIEQKNSNKYK
ncbi:cupin-like domain-containing protein [Nostoc sp. ChiQUE01b]|uniref:cupin-like domain-containing protein n=1 Tax=Nostoc sp. ChiQUE01b TaxID=3075376 RepID=UPI002AD24796|nr:cupin-like domain-containing protein [Nostoc sp. ChiQUE01b]MDZ8261472.1 cupin-like domain-containing protein [Nostoc sp. ChiQUE01b]